MSFRPICRAAFAAVIMGLFGSAPARAEDPPAAKDDAKPATIAATPQEIAQWIQDLDSNTFTTRQTAARKLAEVGQDAIDPLAKAAAGESLEVTRQALDILRRHYQSGEVPLKDAAQAALKKLAESENKSAAARASEILPQPPAPNVAQPDPFRPVGGGRIIIGGGGVLRLGGGGRSIEVRNVNGVKTVDVEDNGKKVKIEENNGIKITTIEKVNGQEQTETTEAKDLDELKKKNPEAAKAYEKYVNAGLGNIQIQGAAPALPLQVLPGQGGIQIQNPVPIQIPNPVPAPAAAQPVGPRIVVLQDEMKKASESVEQAQKSLEQALEQLKQNPDAAAKKFAEVKLALEEIQAHLEAAEARRGANPAGGRRTVREAAQRAANEAAEARKAAEDDLKAATKAAEQEAERAKKAGEQAVEQIKKAAEQAKKAAEEAQKKAAQDPKKIDFGFRN